MRPPVVELRAALIKTTLLFFFCSYTHAHAQLVTTTITDTINNFDGTPFTGNLTIIGASFQAPGAVPVIGGSKTIHITKGALSTKLVPNDTGTPANTYYVLNFSSGLSKTCSVPTSSTPLTLDSAGCIDGTPAAVLDTLMLSQLQQGGASTGQALCWLGTRWGPGSCGSGGTVVNTLQGLSGAVTLATSTAALGWTVAGSIITLNIPTASGSTRGLLSSTDWTTFNNKQPTITDYSSISSLPNYPTAFTPSAHASTHASIGSDPITIAESQVTSLLSDLATKQATLVSYSTISGLTGYPGSFTPSVHASTHAGAGSDPVTITESQVTNLTTDLAGKAASNAATTVNGQTCALGSTCTISVGGITTTPNVLAGDNAGNAVSAGFAPSVVVLTSGSYSNPGWITALANTKITGLTAFATLATGAPTTYVRGDATTQTHNCSAITDAGFYCSGTDAANLTGTLSSARLPSTFTIAGPISLSGSGAGVIDLACNVTPSNPNPGSRALFCNSANSNHLTLLDSGGGLTDVQNVINSITLAVPSWLSATGPLTSNGTITISAAGSQTSHQVIGTCGTATSFTPCALVAADIPTIPETGISFTDNITNNVSTTKHGFTPKLPNDVTKYLDGTGVWSVPPGTGSSGISGSGTTGRPAAFTGSAAIGDATAHNLSAVETCVAASASGTAYTCSTATTFTPAAGDMVLLKADVANTASATLNVNASSAQTIKKQGGGTNLSANDLLANQYTVLLNDGTNWQMQGQTGNAGAGGTTVTYSQPYIQFSSNSYASSQDTVPSGSFSWVDQGTSTVTTTAGGALHFLFQSSGSNVARGYTQATPGSTWTMKIHCKNGPVPGCGFILTSASVCRSLFYGFSDNKFHIFSYTNSTCSAGAAAVSATTTLYAPPGDFWMQLKEDGSHRTLSISAYDGDYQQILQEASNAGLTPTNMGIGVDANNTNTLLQEAYVTSFSLTTP